MKQLTSLLQRKTDLFMTDVRQLEADLSAIVSEGRFLLLGGAGSIGQALVCELLSRQPKLLHVVDLSENNLAELVRHIRSSVQPITGEFLTFALDIASPEFDALMQSVGDYDYVLNLSALKHVRSEKDPYTLMRMLTVNVSHTQKTLDLAVAKNAQRYFSVSTDKAVNPANLMGASKSIMEQVLSSFSDRIHVNSARFANVAFSDGSLLHSFTQRIQKHQPLAAPDDVKRYFLSSQEAGRLCLLASLVGENCEIFFPKLDHGQDLRSFWDIAKSYVELLGYRPKVCDSEEQAKALMTQTVDTGEWPCLKTSSDTTGEKEIEIFLGVDEQAELERFHDIGITQAKRVSEPLISNFIGELSRMRASGSWTKQDLICAIKPLIDEFSYHDVGHYLDGKM